MSPIDVYETNFYTMHSVITTGRLQINKIVFKESGVAFGDCKSFDYDDDFLLEMKKLIYTILHKGKSSSSTRVLNRFFWREFISIFKKLTLSEKQFLLSPPEETTEIIIVPRPRVKAQIPEEGDLDYDTRRFLINEEIPWVEPFIDQPEKIEPAGRIWLRLDPGIEEEIKLMLSL